MALARGPKPSDLLTAKAFDNAIRANMAIGGSTNAIVHLVAIAGRAEVPLPLRHFDALSRATPLLVSGMGENSPDRGRAYRQKC